VYTNRRQQGKLKLKSIDIKLGETEHLAMEESSSKPDIPSPVNGNSTPEKRKKIQMKGGALVGSLVSTFYGEGIVQGYREDDRIYEIKLNHNNNSKKTSPMLYTTTVPEKLETRENEAEKLNVAYVALEKMRRLNLEMQCFDAGVTQIDYDYCTACLLNNSIPSKRFPRLQKMYEDQTVASESAIRGIRNFAATTNANVAKATAPLATNIASENALRGIRNFAATTNAVATAPLKRVQGLWGTDNSKPAAAKQEASGNYGIRLGIAKIPGLWGAKQTNNDKIAASDTPPKSNMPQASAPPQKRVLPRIQNLMDARLKNQSAACLICASPSCPEHSSASFRKDGITICLSCERLFELDFIMNCVSEPDPQIRAKHIDHMIDCYDRCLLLLKYSSRYVEQIAASLEKSQEQQNKIGLGSSGVGVLSGVLGIAAAASILTPAGPPLLIASLVFGGTATTAQVGSEAMNYLSEPNKLADRIIALHGMTLSILRVTSTLRDAMMRDYIRTDGVFEVDQSTIPEQLQEKFEKNRTVIQASANAGRSMALGGVALSEAGAVAGAEVGAIAARAASAEASAAAAAGAAGARGATTMSRAGTASATAARSSLAGFARFAGGALSAAVIVMEANAIHHTLKSIEEGNPCEKAKTMRQILQEINDSSLPSTTALDAECQTYLNAMASRHPPLPEVDAEAAEGQIDQFPAAECFAASDHELSAPGAVILGGDSVGDLSLSVASIDESNQSSRLTPLMNTGSSLFERIQNHQQRQTRQSRREDEVFAVALDTDQAAQAELELLS